MDYIGVSCQTSLQDMCLMIASHRICISVYADQLSLYISKMLHIAKLPKCANIIFFVTPSGHRDFLFFQLLEARLVSDTLSCGLVSSLSLPPSLFLSCFSLVFHIDWDVTQIFIVVRWSDNRLFTIHHTISRCCNSLNVLVIQLFDKSPKLLIIRFKFHGSC